MNVYVHADSLFIWIKDDHSLLVLSAAATTAAEHFTEALPATLRLDVLLLFLFVVI